MVTLSTLPCKIPHSSKRKPSTQVRYWYIRISQSVQFNSIQFNPHTAHTDSRRKKERKKRKKQGPVSTSVSVSVSASVSLTFSSPFEQIGQFQQIRGRILNSTSVIQPSRMDEQTDGQIDSVDQRWPTRCTYSLSVLQLLAFQTRRFFLTIPPLNPGVAVSSFPQPQDLRAPMKRFLLLTLLNPRLLTIRTVHSHSHTYIHTYRIAIYLQYPSRILYR